MLVKVITKLYLDLPTTFHKMKMIHLVPKLLQKIDEVIVIQPHAQTSHPLDLEWSGLALWVMLRGFSNNIAKNSYSGMDEKSIQCFVNVIIWYQSIVSYQ